MRIQVITNQKRDIPEGVDVNKLNSPMSFDDYDLNVIDLTSEDLWKYTGKRLESINSIEDFDSIHDIVCGSNSSITVYVFPKNAKAIWNYSYLDEKYHQIDELKNHIDSLIALVMSRIIPCQDCSWFDVTYERNKTVLGEMTYESDFYFSSPYVFDKESILTQSTSKKKTTIRLNERIVLTTCDIFQSQDALMNYIDNLFVPSTSNAIPEWVREFEFNDDGILKTQLDSEKNRIREAENTIESINKKIEINNEYKSILYASGNQLVKGVFSILERMLEIDLTQIAQSISKVLRSSIPSVDLAGLFDVSSTISESMRSIMNAYTSSIDFSSLIAPFVAFGDILFDAGDDIDNNNADDNSSSDDDSDDQ